MSTKTTFKRVALVAVAALGFGGLSVITAPSASAVAASMTVDFSSITAVGAPASVSQSLAAYRFTVLDADGVAVPLASDETITVTIKSAPAAFGAITPAVDNFTLAETTNQTTMTPDTGSVTYSAVLNQLLKKDGKIGFGANTCTSTSQLSTAMNTGKYCMAVASGSSVTVGPDYGTYTLQADLTQGSVTLTRLTMSFKSVTSAADSGALITVASAGTLVSGGAHAPASSTSYMRATVTDANAGRLVVADTSSATAMVPTLTANLENALGTVTQTLIATDTTTGYDYTPTTGAVTHNGVYALSPGTIGSNNVGSSFSLTAATVIRVRYGLTNSTGSIQVLDTPTAHPSSSLRSVTGTGLYTATETTTASNAQTYNVPLTTKDVTVSITAKNIGGTALANAPLTFTTTWSGANSGDVTPVSGSTGASIKYTNSSGTATFVVSQANALTGSTAAIDISGAGATYAAFGTVTIAWLAPAATKLSVSTPNASFKALAASSVSIVIKAKDQFNNGVAGVVIQPSLPSTSANYTVAAKPTLVTGADGTVTMTYTAGAAVTSDAWTFASPGVTSATRTASYVATLPVISSLTGYYNADETAGTYPNLFSTTSIGATTAQLIERGLNYGASIVSVTGNTTDTRNEFRIQALDSAGAAVTGVPVTISVTAGGHMLDTCLAATAAKPVTSMTCYPDADGYVFVRTIATGTGTITYTATAGAVTASQALKAGNASADSRTVKLVVSGSDVTASVTDRFGNGVADQSVQVTVTGGSLTGGSKIATYTTDASGNFGFGVEGASTVTARLGTANDSESVAGKTVSTIIDSTVAAGVRSASATVVGTDSSSSVAQAAADAAAEATDAANAATDAANAAAEAADAATAAAQDAADAVAALSAQVATLISGLKAQLTALTNLVIKIQKKVKA